MIYDVAPIVSQALIDLAPGWNTLDKALDPKKDEWDVGLAVAEDLSTVLVIGGPIKGWRFGRAAYRIGLAIETGLAVAKVGQGAYKAYQHKDSAEGYLQIGEGLLRLAGVGASVAVFRKATADLVKTDKAAQTALARLGETGCFAA